MKADLYLSEIWRNPRPIWVRESCLFSSPVCWIRCWYFKENLHMKHFWESVKKNEVRTFVYLQDISHNTQTPEKKQWKGIKIQVSRIWNIKTLAKSNKLSASFSFFFLFFFFNFKGRNNWKSHHKSLAVDTGFIRITSGARKKNKQKIFSNFWNISFLIPSPWRNRLARSAVNRKVGGSSPPGDEFAAFVIHFYYDLTRDGYPLFKQRSTLVRSFFFTSRFLKVTNCIFFQLKVL